MSSHKVISVMLYAVALVRAGTNTTRGNELRLVKVRPKYDLRKYSFSNRIVNIWNSLPNWVVSANNTNTFKNRLDKYWENQDITYDFKAQLHGIGSRSEYSENN